MRNWLLYLALAVLGWTISGQLERPSNDRLLHRIEENYFVEHADVDFEAGLAATLLSDSDEDERGRTTSAFYLRLHSTDHGRPLTREQHIYTRTSPKHRHPTPPDGPFITPDGAYVLVGAYFPQQEIRIFDVRAGKFKEQTVPVRAVGGNGWSAGKSLVSYRCGAGYVVIDPAEARIVQDYQPTLPELRTSRVVLSPDDNLVAAATNQGLVVGPARAAGAPQVIHPGAVSRPIWAKGGEWLVFLSEGNMMIYDAKRKSLVGRPIQGTYESVQVSLDGKLAIAANRQGIDVLELPAGKLRCRRERPRPYFADDAELLSPAGNQVLAVEPSGGTNPSLLVWETGRAQTRFTLAQDKRPLELAAIAGDGRAGATRNGREICIWRL